jgi:TrmH family RNA methyltransferase
MTLALFFAQNTRSVTLFLPLGRASESIPMDERFKDIAVVLVRPAGGLNIGSAARAMKNTGFGDLVLVASRDPHRSRDARNMAVSSADILQRARVVESLDAALSDRHAAFGVTARPRHKRPRLDLLEAAGKIRDLSGQGRRIALVFGPEDKGLSSGEIDRCQHLIGIPAHPDLTSYNLAQAVLLVCHALFMSREPALEEVKEPVPASHADRERIENRALELLECAGYLTPNREAVLRDMIRRLVYRAPLESRDARNLLAAIRHLLIRA